MNEQISASRTDAWIEEGRYRPKMNGIGARCFCTAEAVRFARRCEHSQLARELLGGLSGSHKALKQKNGTEQARKQDGQEAARVSGFQAGLCRTLAARNSCVQRPRAAHLAHSIVN
jgi:hypothetical protein